MTEQAKQALEKAFERKELPSWALNELREALASVLTEIGVATGKFAQAIEAAGGV
ncbi:MAG: hypothetical protein RMK89_03295 [Armatimonadota bacterium]|nr:hypothetical protein [Armatimonadota bacterium]MDW8142470.1 hypothetical protein [Armatimonadota bacterium]